MSESTTYPLTPGHTPVLPIVRVAILSERRLTEVALPAELPLREILPAVHRLLPGDAADVTPRQVSLAPIGGAPFSLDASLDTVGVVDGDLLAVAPIPVGPAAPGIVEDIADAAVIFSSSRLRPWGIQHVRLAARTAVVATILAITALAVTHTLATASPYGLYAVAVLAAVTAVAALLLRARAQDAAVEVAIATLAPIGAAFYLAVPGDLGAAQVLLAAAGVTAWSLISVILAPTEATASRAFFTAATVVGAGVVLAAGVSVLWPTLPLLSLGCGLIVAALLVTVQAAQLSAMWARLPLPVIPAPGDPTPSAPPVSVLRDLPRRVRISEAHQTGFIAGATVLSVLGAVALGGRPESPSLWAWYVVVATGVAAVLRARVWDTVACKAWLLAQPHLVTVILLAVFITQGRYFAALWAAAVLLGLVACWVFVAANPKLASAESYSLPMRRLVGFLASAVDASLIPVMAYLVGIFTWILDR